MTTIIDRFIKPAFQNFSWRPNREWVLVLSVTVIVLSGALDFFQGEVDAGTAIDIAVTAILGLFVRGQSTSLAEPRDFDGRPLQAIDSGEQ